MKKHFDSWVSVLVTQLLRIVKAVKVHLRKLIYSIKKKQNSLSIFHYIESGGLGLLGQVAWEHRVAGANVYGCE